MSNRITPLTKQQTDAEESRAQNEPYPERVAETLDIAGNVITGGLQDETWSARFGRWAANYKGARRTIGRLMCRALNLAQKDHGANAIAGAVGHAEKVIETEDASGLINQG